MKPTDNKLRGGGNSALTALKSLCLQEFEKEGSSPTLEQIMTWAADGKNTNAIVRQRIGEFFQVQLARDSQLSSFYSWVKLTRKTHEREAKVQHWLECEKLEHPELSDELLFQRGQRKFKLVSIAEEDPEAWTSLLHADREKEKQLTNREKIQLDRDKFYFDAAKAAMGKVDALKKIKKSNLSEDEKIQQARLELFGEEAVK